MKTFDLSCLDIFHFLLKFVIFLLRMKGCQLFIKGIYIYFRAQLLVPEVNALCSNDVVEVHLVFL